MEEYIEGGEGENMPPEKPRRTVAAPDSSKMTLTGKKSDDSIDMYTILMIVVGVVLLILIIWLIMPGGMGAAAELFQDDSL